MSILSAFSGMLNADNCYINHPHNLHIPRIKFKIEEISCCDKDGKYARKVALNVKDYQEENRIWQARTFCSRSILGRNTHPQFSPPFRSDALKARSLILFVTFHFFISHSLSSSLQQFPLIQLSSSSRFLTDIFAAGLHVKPFETVGTAGRLA